MLLAFVPSEITVSPLFWATSNRAAAEETPALASLFFTLNRAALRSLSDVIHTVPSSSCTCRCVTELTMMAPATMPSSRSSMTIGVIHWRPPDGRSLLSSDPNRICRSYDCADWFSTFLCLLMYWLFLGCVRVLFGCRMIHWLTTQ